MSFFINTYAWVGCLIIGAALNIFVAQVESHNGMVGFQTALWGGFIAFVIGFLVFSSFFS